MPDGMDARSASEAKELAAPKPKGTAAFLAALMGLRSNHDLEESPFPGDAFQLVATTVFEEKP